MALKNRTQGKNAFVYDGTTLIGCSKSIDLDVSVTELEAACQGTGEVEPAEAGRKKVTGNMTMQDRMATSTDAASNITGDDLFTKAMNGTEITIKWGSETVDDIIYTGVGFITKWAPKNAINSIGTVDISFRFNSITKSTVSA